MARRSDMYPGLGSTFSPPLQNAGRTSLPLTLVKLTLVLTAAFGNALGAPMLQGQGAHKWSISSHGGEDSSDGPPLSTADLIFDVLGIAALVLGGGLCAGLTLSLMGLDSVNLQVLSTAGSDSEKRNAVKVLRLLDRGRHWVLVVLLLSNVIVNETLPIFLADFGGTAAVLTSTVLIVIFGEVLPQSICARYGLSIGAACAPFVWFLMLILSPIAWPTAKLLDRLLGEDHGTTYKKAELKTFVSLHQQLGTENLNEDEVTIIRAVLDLNDKTVRDVMTPVQDVFVMSADTVLDEEGVGKLVQSGYSRVPVHEKGKPDSIVGMLLVKDLISYDPEDGREVGSFQLRALPETGPELTLLSTLNYFQTGRSHMLLVSESPGEPKGALGIVTLEDVVEELIGEEIIDETDVWVDVHNRVRVTRNPKESGQAANADLGPLVRGIIERRRLGGLKPKAGSTAPLSRGVANQVRAIDRVHFKSNNASASPNRLESLSRRNSREPARLDVSDLAISSGGPPPPRSRSAVVTQRDSITPQLIDIDSNESATTADGASEGTTLVNEPQRGRHAAQSQFKQQSNAGGSHASDSSGTNGNGRKR